MPVSTKTKNNRTRKKNSRKSTGPKTKKGKEKSSQNAVKHGFYAKNVIITSPHLNEDPQEYHALLQSLIDEFDPQTVYEQNLIEKIANCMWRQRRVAIAETAHIEEQLDEVDEKMDSKRKFRRMFHEYEEDEDPLGDDEDVEQMRSVLAGQRAIPEDDFSITLLRYEMRLDRQLTRTFKLLFQLEERRNRMKDRQREEEARLVGQEPSSSPATNRQVTPPQSGSGPDGTCKNEELPKNDETKLDRGDPLEVFRDAVIFVDG